MNIRKTIDNLKKPFNKGEKWERFAPAFNALDTFLYVPNHTTKHGAHIRDAVDLKRTMIKMLMRFVHIKIQRQKSRGIFLPPDFQPELPATDKNYPD